MAADRNMWWEVWGSWMAVWLVTVAALVVAGATAGAYWVRARRHDGAPVPIRHRVQGICFYLRDEFVMNLYLQGDYKALEQEVEEKSRSNTEGNVSAEVHGVGARAGRRAEAEKVIRYIRREQPITVIRAIIDALEEADNIVDVDLINNVLEPGKALDRALVATHGRGAARRRSARLRDLEAFVSVRARFRETARNDDTVTFTAPYGDPADPAGQPSVSVTCVGAGLRHAVPGGPFPARCLGRVQGWDPENRQLLIDPIAMFQ